MPPEILQLDVEMTMLTEKVQLVSPVENPVPVTRTVAPTGADVGVKVRTGEVAVIWTLAVATSPLRVPVAEIV